ncbi:hypothetical protein K503DRAFT_172723 [Rhizopogon vinicolor AM-OR11-026]|uniref:BHLH domain-containing protein n=1 Tax=Rhizopogon vinicolor AM-OR11-026 TaxID=1314800 RepID=A0A1B7N063_9AGAM|nr:hypothetical protein K503DRAFT_172723 [Rhizopogon vinicolor AM-OR11-026]
MHSSDHPQVYSIDSERANPTQDKAKLQRQYRAKETVAFAELQKLLRDISRGTEAPLTRLETIVQATETIKHLYHDTISQRFHGPPLPVPDHSTVDFNSHLAQVQHSSTDWHSFYSDLVDERPQLTGMRQHAPVVHSSGMWNPPVSSDMSMMPGRSFIAGVGMSGGGTSNHYSQFI